MIETQEITIDYLKKLDIEKPMIPLTFDRLTKAFFENNPDIYIRFIINVLHLNLKEDEVELVINNNELPVSHYKEYKKVVDFNVDINENILIGIELNNSFFSSVKLRNYIYKAKKISMNLKKGESTKKLKEIKNIQLNLNAKDKSKNLGEDIVVPYSIITKSVYLNNDVTYIRYLDYYRNLYYNNIEMSESDYWLALLTAKNYTELYQMLSKFIDNKLRDRLVKDVIRLNNDKVIFDEYEQMMGDALIDYEDRLLAIEEGHKEGYDKGHEEGYDKGHEEGYDKGHKEGIEQGIEQNKIQMIKSLLKNNVDYEIISKSSNKTIEEIKEIEKTI